MMTTDELKALIETLGVHPALGPTGEGWGIEQNPDELAAFLTAVDGVETVLEIGTGHKAGLARFLTYHLGMQVTTVDIHDYGHAYPEIAFRIAPVDPAALDDGYDLVILDGDHAYESVKADYERYAPRGRIVMFHDIAGLRDCAGVARFWQELAYTKKGNLRKYHYEALAADDFRSGIGWVDK